MSVQATTKQTGQRKMRKWMVMKSLGDWAPLDRKGSRNRLEMSKEILHVYQCFVCMYVRAPCACPVPVEVRSGYWIHQDQTYR